MGKGVLLGRMHGVKLGGQLSEEVSVKSGVLQGSELGLLLFLAYVNDIWRNTESNIRLFAFDFVLYRKINNEDIEKLQKDLDRLGEWVVENAMKINPRKCKAVSFTRSRVKDPLSIVRRSINSGSEQLQIIGNNLRQRSMFCLSCQLHGGKGPEGTAFHNAYNQKGNSSTKT